MEPRDPVFRLIYRSQVSDHVRLQDAKFIANKAAQNNELFGITGLLVYTSLRFIQVLEGERKAVTDLMGRIVSDARHSHLHVISEAEPVPRLFVGWAMRVEVPTRQWEPTMIDQLDGAAAQRLVEQFLP